MAQTLDNARNHIGRIQKSKNSQSNNEPPIVLHSFQYMIDIIIQQDERLEKSKQEEEVHMLLHCEIHICNIRQII